MTKAKKELRRAVLARRDAIDAHEREARSRVACEQLVRALDALGTPAPLIALYAHLGSEVALDALVATASQRGWRLCFPAMLAEGESEAPMAFFQVDARVVPERPAFLGNQLARYTTAELISRFELVNPEDIDAIVVPLVAFDDNNMRMGYGGGNYDRYLPQLRSDADVLGIAFAEQRVERVPAEPHDMPLAHIVQA